MSSSGTLSDDFKKATKPDADDPDKSSLQAQFDLLTDRLAQLETKLKEEEPPSGSAESKASS